MFKVTKKRVVWWPVTIHEPRDDGTGKTNKLKVKIKYELVDKAGAREVDSLPPEEAEAKLVERILDWEGFADEDGNELPFNQENLADVMGILYAERAIAFGLLDASRGAAAKN